MATNIPPHNMGEVIDGMCTLIDNPDATLEQLMEHIKGPDFPTGAVIMGRSGYPGGICHQARAHHCAGAAEIEEEKNGRYNIIVTELPYQVNKARLIESIADLVRTSASRASAMWRTIPTARVCGLWSPSSARHPQVVLNQLFSYARCSPPSV